MKNKATLGFYPKVMNLVPFIVSLQTSMTIRQGYVFSD